MAKRNSKDPIITISDIEYLKGKGWNQSQIARYYGITRSYVSKIIAEHGKTDPRIQAIREHMPWEIVDGTRTQKLAYAVRDHIALAAVGPEAINDKGMERLRDLYYQIETLGRVIEYDPTMPGNGNDLPAG